MSTCRPGPGGPGRPGRCRSRAGTMRPCASHTLRNTKSVRFTSEWAPKTGAVSSLDDVVADVVVFVVLDHQGIPGDDRLLRGHPDVSTANAGIAREGEVEVCDESASQAAEPTRGRHPPRQKRAHLDRGILSSWEFGSRTGPPALINDLLQDLSPGERYRETVEPVKYCRDRHRVPGERRRVRSHPYQPGGYRPPTEAARHVQVVGLTSRGHAPLHHPHRPRTRPRMPLAARG